MPNQPSGTDLVDEGLEYGVTAVSTRGFKSHAFENRIDIRPLTILAGANSSGKSSIVQPLLLMKQTLEASYDAGPLLLNGPNVRFTSVAQLLSQVRPNDNDQSFAVGIETHGFSSIEMEYVYSSKRELEIRSMSIGRAGGDDRPRIRLTPRDDASALQERLSSFFSAMNLGSLQVYKGNKLEANRDRCFLSVAVRRESDDALGISSDRLVYLLAFVPRLELIRTIHVPGLRGNPERGYPRTSMNTVTSGIHKLFLFPGTFERYVATVIEAWQSSGDSRIDDLQTMLKELGLARAVAAERVDDTRIELRVGAMIDAPSRQSRLTSIADVGFGVSQVLPVLVALLVADAGQLVYVEQPELHLHPRAQCVLARLMADTARRGVRLIVETHSALLLLSVRTLIADGKLDPELVKLHWFTLRPEDGSSAVTTADFDQDGAYGDWPEDFGDVELAAEGKYLDAVEQRNGT